MEDIEEMQEEMSESDEKDWVQKEQQPIWRKLEKPIKMRKKQKCCGESGKQNGQYWRNV